MQEESVLRKTIREIVDPFKSLAGSPQALWALYISYWLEGLVYFGVLTVLGKYLSESVGLADLHAGWVYSGFTGGITLSMLFLGGVADRLGVRKALLLAMSLMVIGRGLLGASGAVFDHGEGATSGMFLLVTAGLAVVVVGYGMYQPAAYAAVKQFTDEKTATMGYAMIYGLMNLGAFFSGIVSPAVRKSVGPELGAFLGVPAGQDMGIVAVLLVYIGVTISAFLAIWLFMSKGAVKRATLTNIDAPTETPEGGEGEGKPAAAPRAKLFTPTFALFTGGAVVACVAIVTMALTAPRLPEERVFADAKAAFKGAGKALEGDTVTPEMTAAIGTLSRDLAGLADSVADRKVNPGEGAEDPWLRRGLAATLISQATFLTHLGPNLGDKWTAGEGAEEIKAEVRSLGIAFMAGAYAMVSEVDDEVLNKLCARMTEPGSEPVPLSAETRAAILGMSGDNAREIAKNLIAMAGDTVRQLMKGEYPQAGVAAEMIAVKGRILEDLVADGEEEISGPRGDLLSEQLLHGAVFFLRALPPVLSEKKGDEEQDLRVLVGAWIASEADLSSTLEGMAPAVVQVPTRDRLVRWGTRYGLLLAAALLFLVLLGRSLLRKRPDHPFNDSRFVFFIFVLIPVQTLFAHNWLTLPYYIDRAFGGTAVGDNFEFFSNINPILIFVLAPAVAAITTRAKVYPMMIWGTLVMAVPTFLLVLPPSPALLLTYILLMSIGEAMWQPRFLQWVAEIAPEGQTGMYMGIGQFPWFLTKVLTGLYSGYFLTQYCPMVGPQDTQTMWFIYALIAMVSPTALWLARGWMLRGTGNKAMG